LGTAALLRQGAGGGQGDHLRDRNVGAAWGWTSTTQGRDDVLRALSGRAFSALQLICIMYVGFKRIEPGMDIGVELGEEWEMAEKLMDFQ